jgi:hypothetical protein
MEFPTGSVITGFATVVAVVIANKLSSSQSGQARLWDFRRQAYGVILSELASVERVCATVDEYMAEDAERYFGSDVRGKHEQLISESMTTLRRRFSDDYLILSDAFIALFEGFRADLAAGAPDEGFLEADERFSEAVRKHRPLLLAQARSEVAKRRRRWLFMAG